MPSRNAFIRSDSVSYDRVHAGEHRVAAARRDGVQMQDAAHRRLGIARYVAVPLARPRCAWSWRRHGSGRISGCPGGPAIVRMDVQLAEQPAERLLAIQREPLVAEEQHHDCSASARCSSSTCRLLSACVMSTSGHLRADARRDRPDSDRLVLLAHASLRDAILSDLVLFVKKANAKPWLPAQLRYVLSDGGVNTPVSKKCSIAASAGPVSMPCCRSHASSICVLR